MTKTGNLSEDGFAPPGLNLVKQNVWVLKGRALN
jgi:hypothetical protein